MDCAPRRQARLAHAWGVALPTASMGLPVVRFRALPGQTFGLCKAMCVPSMPICAPPRTEESLAGRGGGLVGQFYDAGLLDELIIQIGSVTLGAGKPLLPRQLTSPSLRLVSVQQYGTGLAELRYEVPVRA